MNCKVCTPHRSAATGALRSRRDGRGAAGEGRAPADYGRVSGERTEAVVEESVRKMSEKAIGMLKHMRRQIFGQPAPYVEVRGAALSIGVNPAGSECDDLVDELLQAGYIRTYPSPSLTAHGLYRLTDRGIAAAKEALSKEGKRQRIRELVHKKTGVDWPELKVADIEKAMSSVTLFYWCTKEDVGKRWLQKQLELTDEEAESIGV